MASSPKKMIRAVKTLEGCWLSLRDFLQEKLVKDEITENEEREFLELKSAIARCLPVLPAGSTDVTGTASRTAKGVEELIGRFDSLADVAPMDHDEVRELMKEWHALFISVNRLSGEVDHHILGPRTMSPQRIRRGPNMFQRIANNWFVHFTAKMIILVAALAAFAKILDILGMNGSPLWDWLVTLPKQIPTALYDALVPVVSSYGVGATVFLAGVLILAWLTLAAYRR
jgi:hypothetical protein